MFTTSEIAAFAKGLRGQLLRPGDDNYDEARRVWNGMIDKRPALIVRAAGVGDVIQAVEFARKAARCGAIWTTKPRPSAWRRRAV